jgi:hypothetical protein
MSKMMGRFERQHWLLREYCRQHRISNRLQAEMKRYIDNVVAPSHWRLQLQEVELVGKLSVNLRERLNSEIFFSQISAHPFLVHLHKKHCSVINTISTHALQSVPLARGDVAFSGLQKAEFMLIIGSGTCAYIPILDQTTHTVVSKGEYASEAAFWTKWIHQGQLQATNETHSMLVDGAQFRRSVLRSALCMRVVRDYGNGFCKNLNDLVREKGTLTDLHDFASSYFIQTAENSGSTGGILDRSA